MNTRLIENEQGELVIFKVGMDPHFGLNGPLKLKRIGFIQVVPGTLLAIGFNGKVIYTKQFDDSREILVEVKDVEPYPNCNFWVDDRFLLPGDGISYGQEIEVQTNAPSARIVDTVFVDK